MRFTTPHGSVRYRLPWSWSAFDYRRLCQLLYEQRGVPFQTARKVGRAGGASGGQIAVETDRARSGPAGARRARLAPGAWREGYQPPEAPLSRGLEVHPHIDIDGRTEPARLGGAAAGAPRLRLEVPAGGEARVGVGSYEPADHVREPTEGSPAGSGWSRALPGQLVPASPARRDGGRRVLRRGLRRPLLPALRRGDPDRLYFGIACGRELRAVLERVATAARRRCVDTRASAPHAGRTRSRWPCSVWSRRCRRAC